MAEEASSSTSSSILDKLRPPSAYEKEVHPSGETLPEAQKVYRVKVVSTFLKAGVPLSKNRAF